MRPVSTYSFSAHDDGSCGLLWLRKITDQDNTEFNEYVWLAHCKHFCEHAVVASGDKAICCACNDAPGKCAICSIGGKTCPA